jgi:hypothetical protein
LYKQISALALLFKDMRSDPKLFTQTGINVRLVLHRRRFSATYLNPETERSLSMLQVHGRNFMRPVSFITSCRLAYL